MRRIRGRLRMLVLLVAIAGLVLGAQRWWRVRQEIALMAAWHEWRAQSLANLAQWIGMSEAEQSDDDPFESVQSENLLRLKIVEQLERVDQPTPPALREASRAHQQQIEASLAAWSVWRDRMAEASSDASAWHRRRADELRGRFYFARDRERETDRRRWKEEADRALQIENDKAAALAAIRDRFAPYHQEARRQLAELIGLAGAPDSPITPSLVKDLQEYSELHADVQETEMEDRLGQQLIVMRFQRVMPTYQLPAHADEFPLPPASQAPEVQTR